MIPKYFESIIPLKNFIFNNLRIIAENMQPSISIVSFANAIPSTLIKDYAQSKMSGISARTLNFDKLR